jgi:DHA2 family methylenomycin A resistance protein-like MFS transporter
MPAATAAVVEGAPPERTGVASGTFNASRQVGGAIGIALLGAFVAGGPANFVPGLRVSMILAGVTYVLAAALALTAHLNRDQSQRYPTGPQPWCVVGAPVSTGTVTDPTRLPTDGAPP